MKRIWYLSIFVAMPVFGHCDAVAQERITAVSTMSEIYGHGGGCRKSSPPGQCCHMDRKTGVVHCH